MSTADQLPGCTIPDKCMVQADKGPTRRDAFCENDLKCICKTDNHLGSNSLFSNECLLQECTDGHDRKLFLKNWLESCREVGKSGWDDMPWAWEPYLPNDGEVIVGPTTFLNASPTTTIDTKQSSVSVVTTTAAVATSLPVDSFTSVITTTSSGLSTATNSPTATSTFGPDVPATTTQSESVTVHTLSGGAIAGIVAGILLLAALLGVTGYFYLRANKKANEKNREVAILSDRVSGCGFQQRIDELLAQSIASTNTILQHDTPTPTWLTDRPAGSSSTVAVTSASSSVYSVDIARAF